MPTTVNGPFTVVGGEVKTGVQVNPGDGVIISASGEVDFGGAVFGIGAPVLGPEGDNSNTPSNYPAPSLRKNSLIGKVGARFYQVGRTRSFSPFDSGELILLANDADPEDNSRGWTVYVYHTLPGEPMPTVGQWRLFETLEGAGGIFGADVGASPSAVLFGGREHVFYGGDEQLHHLSYLNSTDFKTEVLDGWQGGLFEGVTFESVVGQITATVHAGAIHVFYFNGSLRHTMSTDGVTWTSEDVDGAGGTNGRINGIVGAFNRGISFGGELHVFYYASTNLDLGPGAMGEGVSVVDLRHAVMGANGWRLFETLDGQGGPDGRVSGNVGDTLSAAVDPVGVLHVFYYHLDKSNLRHGWWNGQKWQFETLDGSGDPDPGNPPDGQTRAKVGGFSTPAVFDNELYVFYHDMSWRNVRLATQKPGQPWQFQKLDGGPINGKLPNGRISANVGNGQMAAISYLDQISLFYWDADHGDLRHAWKKRGSNWSFETLDGEGGEAGRIKGNVGKDVTGLVVHVQSSSTSGYDMLSIFYYDSGNTDLRHAFSF